MVHNGDSGRGIIGVIDVTDLMVNVLILAKSVYHLIFIQLYVREETLTLENTHNLK